MKKIKNKRKNIFLFSTLLSTIFFFLFLIQQSSLFSTTSKKVSGIDTTATITPIVNQEIYTGTGRDGEIMISATKNINTDVISVTRTKADGEAFQVLEIGSNTIRVVGNGTDNTQSIYLHTSISTGDEVLIINLQGTESSHSHVGNYEFCQVENVTGPVIFCSKNFTTVFGESSNNDLSGQKIIVQRVPQYTNITIDYTGGLLTGNAWDGVKGGIVVFRATGAVNNLGVINMIGKGYRGGSPNTEGSIFSHHGEGITVEWNTYNQKENYGGGGSGWSDYGRDFDTAIGGAGGGGYGTDGTDGTSLNPDHYGHGGTSYGVATLKKIFLGSGGGSGGNDTDGWPFVNFSGGYDGHGGGIVMIYADSINNLGAIQADGLESTFHNGAGGGGGGSGGSILLVGKTIKVGLYTTTALGGIGNLGDAEEGNGGNGGSGRIATYYENINQGISDPPSYTEAILPLFTATITTTLFYPTTTEQISTGTPFTSTSTPIIWIPPDVYEIEPELLTTLDDDDPEMASWITDSNTTSAYHNLHKSSDVDWLQFNISLLGRYRVFISNDVLLYLYNSSLKGHLATNNPDDQAYYESISELSPQPTQSQPDTTTISSNEQSLGIKGLYIQAKETSLSSFLEYNFYYPGTYYIKVLPNETTTLSESNYYVKIIPLIPTPTVSPVLLQTPLAIIDGFDTATNFSDNWPETARPFLLNWERHFNSLHSFEDQDWKSFLLTQPQMVTFLINNPNSSTLQLKIFRVFSEGEQTQTGIFEWVPWGKVTQPDSNISVNVEVIKNLYLNTNRYVFQYYFSMPGTYYVGIIPPDIAENKYYELLIFSEKDYVSSLDRWDQWLPIDNSLNTASYILINGIEQKHTFSDITDQDWLTFQAEYQKQYTIDLYGELNTHLNLFQSSTNGLVTLEERTFSGFDSFVFTAPASDSFYLHFTPSDSFSSPHTYLIKIMNQNFREQFPAEYTWDLETPTATTTQSLTPTSTTTATPLASTTASPTSPTLTATITNTPYYSPTITATYTATLHPFFSTPNSYSDRLSVLVLYSNQQVPENTPTDKNSLTQYTGIPISGSKVSISTYNKYQYTDYNGMTTFESITGGKYTIFAEYRGYIKWVEIDTTQQRYAQIIFYSQAVSSEPSTLKNPEAMPETGFTLSFPAFFVLFIALGTLLSKKYIFPVKLHMSINRIKSQASKKNAQWDLIRKKRKN